MTSTVHPFFMLAAFSVVVAMILVVAAFRVRRWLLKVMLLLVALSALAPVWLAVLMAFPEWVDDRFRTYKAFYSDIAHGMTRDEVMALRDRHYPEGGLRARPKIVVDHPESLSFFMDPENPESTVDAEGILLDLKDGRVVSKSYSPD